MKNFQHKYTFFHISIHMSQILYESFANFALTILCLQISLHCTWKNCYRCRSLGNFDQIYEPLNTIESVTYFNVDLVSNVLGFPKVGPSRKICFICLSERPLKMTKNTFYFILKPLFVLKIFICWSWIFGYVEKKAWLERKG